MFEYYSQATLLDMLAALVDAGAPLDTLKIHLFKNDVEVGPITPVANLVEADYDGYAASAAVVWGTPFLNANLQAEVVGPTKQFQPTGSVVTNLIYGYWLMPTIATTYPTKVVRFDEPVPMAGVTNALFVTPTFVLRQP